MHLDVQLRAASGELLTDCLQIHLLELSKYGDAADNEVSQDPIHQWMHFFRFASSSTANELQRLLPDPVFTEARGVLEMIAKKPDERRYYESRLKMQRDEQARLEAAEERGVAIGRVRVLESLVGIPETIIDALCLRTLEELSDMEGR